MIPTDDYKSIDWSGSWADGDALRTSFTLAMSAMYKAEVPLYGDLLKIVEEANNAALTADMDPHVRNLRFGAVNEARLDIERHGAIRLGTAKELETIRKVFAIFGLYPVGYYDLSEAGLPMHATCFRPITRKALDRNPFRVFTSVLRPDLIKSKRARELAEQLTTERNIFSEELLRLLHTSSTQAGRFTPQQGGRFVVEAIQTFQWQGKATATEEQYNCLREAHPVLADICCFGTSHINHLTPRTLDIIKAQSMMEDAGMECKDRIEGPTPRACPILLRQTSFLAIEESIRFRRSVGKEPDAKHPRRSIDSAGPFDAHHRARFGEIEERGAAVTRRGRALYDELTAEVMRLAKAPENAATSGQTEQQTRDKYDRVQKQVFSAYPDDWETLRSEKLVYFSYHVVGPQESASSTQSSSPGKKLLPRVAQLADLLANGTVEAIPITYEDFLPLSAAGIFQSNIGSSASQTEGVANPDPEGMESAMQANIMDSDLIYNYLVEKSLEDCSLKLGVKIVY